MDNQSTNIFNESPILPGSMPKKEKHKSLKDNHGGSYLVIILVGLIASAIILVIIIIILSIIRQNTTDTTKVAGETPETAVESEIDSRYIQDFTLDMCKAHASDTDYTLTDIRDGKTYTVRYIASACWMTQNLAIGPDTPMTAADTNIPDVYTEESPYSFSKGTYDYAQLQREAHECSWDKTGNPNLDEEYFYNICYHIADATDSETRELSIGQLGAWYNYAAATAGTIVGNHSEAKTEATYDICPKGWHLPTFIIEYVDGHFQDNLRNGTSEASGTIYDLIRSPDGKMKFNPVNSGSYTTYNHNMRTPKPTEGMWWSANGYSHPSNTDYVSAWGERIIRNYVLEARFALNYNRDMDGKLNFGDYMRNLGASIRCVRSE